MRDVDRLAACLADLDRDGWKVGDYLSAQPDLPGALRLGLQAAGRVRGLTRPSPSEAFRARSRSHLVTFIQSKALRSRSRSGIRRIRRAFDTVFRPILAPLAAAILVLGGSAGVWSASASALPGTPLYFAKVGIEQIQLLTALTPDQQVWVHLNVASKRLLEANAEAWAGQPAEEQALLRAYDSEIAQAQSILLSTATATGSDNLLAQSDLQLVLLQEERQRLVASGLAPTATTVTTASAPAAVAQATGSNEAVAGEAVAAKPTVSPEDPSKLVQRGPNSESDDSPTSNGPTNLQQPQGLVGVTGGVQVSGVGVAPPDSAAKTSAPPVAVSVADRIQRLVLVLLAQASAGDVAAANTTSRKFVLDVKTGKAAGSLSVDRLMFDRSRLEAALAVAPDSTKASLQLALEAIYTAVPGSRPAPPPASVAPASPPPASVASASPPQSPDGPNTPPGPVGATQPGPVPPAPNSQPVATTPNPQPVGPAPAPGGPQHSVGVGQPTAPVIAPPIISSPLIPNPIIVRDPNHLPSPALTGRKPLVTTAP